MLPCPTKLSASAWELSSKLLKPVCGTQPDWWALSQQESPEPSSESAGAAPAAAPTAAADAAASSPAALPTQNGHALQTPSSLDEAGQPGEWVPIETAGPKRPPPRYEHAVAVIGSSMYMVGGNCSMSPGPSSSFLPCSCKPNGTSMVAVEIWQHDAQSRQHADDLQDGSGHCSATHAAPVYHPPQLHWPMRTVNSQASCDKLQIRIRSAGQIHHRGLQQRSKSGLGPVA